MASNPNSLANLNREGRPPKSRNKSTTIFRSFWADEGNFMAVPQLLLEIIKNPDEKASDRIRASECVLKYTVAIPRDELVDDVIKLTNNDDAKAALALIRQRIEEERNNGNK